MKKNKFYLRRSDKSSYLSKRTKITLTHSQKQQVLDELYEELAILRSLLVIETDENKIQVLKLKCKFISKFIKEL